MSQKVKFKSDNSIFSKPDFLIIGAMKSGTTSVFHYLSRHSDIIPPEYKEPAFFAWHYDKGFDWYLSKFPKKADKHNKLTFEATPTYLHIKESPQRIKNYLPNVKLIVVLRNPVDRAFSHWSFFHDSNYVNETSYRLENLKDNREFDIAINQELNGYIKSPAHAYLGNGYYYEQIKRFSNLFGKEKILVLDFEELKNDLSGFMGKICCFLKIKNEFNEARYSNKKKNNLIFKSKTKESSALENNEFAKHNYNKNNKIISNNIRKKLNNHFREKNALLNNLANTNFNWY